MNKAYHVTTGENIETILRDGLIPKIGERSVMLGETVASVYFFNTYADLIDGLGNWFGELMEDVRTVHILEVNLEGIARYHDPGIDFELRTDRPVSASRIKYMHSETD